MVTPSITAERKVYRGWDPKKRAKAAQYNHEASLLEDHINAQIAKGRRGVFLYHDIARETGIPVERVTECLVRRSCQLDGL
jgi:hypothetical protein